MTSKVALKKKGNWADEVMFDNDYCHDCSGTDMILPHVPPCRTDLAKRLIRLMRQEVVLARTPYNKAAYRITAPNDLDDDASSCYWRQFPKTQDFCSAILCPK